MRAIILAGGFGTRLRERVSDVPKPMAPIAGRPFLEYQLDILNECGIKSLVLATGYLAEKISSHFGDVYKNIKIQYAVEKEPLGTGGAILYAMEAMDSRSDEPVLILNGDTFLKVDLKVYMEWFSKENPDIGMVLRSVSDASRYGSVKYVDGEIKGFQEKGQAGGGLINGGIYILSRQVLSAFDVGSNFSLEEDVLQKFYDKMRISGFICDGFFLDIGTPEDFDEAQTVLPMNV